MIESFKSERLTAQDNCGSDWGVFKAVFNNCLEAMLVTSPSGRIFQANAQACKLFGMRENEICRVSRDELFVREDGCRAGEFDDRHKNHNCRGKVQIRRKDGTDLLCELTSVIFQTDEGQQMCIDIFQDVATRGNAEEEAIRKHRDMLVKITNQVPGVVYQYRLFPDGRLAMPFASSGLTRMFEVTPEEVRDCAAPLFDLLHTEDRHRVIQEIHESAITLKPLHSEFRVDLPKQGVRWRLCDAIPERTEDGGTLWYGIVSDVTERKTAEEVLREREGAHTKMVANIGDVITIFDQQGINRYKSPNVEKWFGWRPEELVGRRTLENVHPEDLGKAQEFISKLLAAPNASGTEQCRYKCKDGSYRWIEFTGVNMLHDPQIGGILGNYQDITERKELETLLRQAQKLESVGHLAGGVAHDFNNILAAILMHLSLLQEKEHSDSETMQYLTELETEALRAANLTRQLLTFSRRSVLEMKLLDLNDVVADLLKMLGRLIGEHITVVFERREGLPGIEADAGMVEQVLMNLAVNARDAMPDGGVLKISLTTAEADENRLRSDPQVKRGEYVCLSVSDTGCGMEPALLKQIFDPFFTTKEPGKGTGLGLATVHGIVAQHKGWIDVQSEPGNGSCFKVYFPCRSRRAEKEKAKPKNILARGNGETILLVEDEPSLRRALGQSLRAMGYAVLEASDGKQAMGVWQEHRERIDLLFSDMVMPEGMTGLDLAEALRKDRQQLRVIVSSGYNADTSKLSSLADGGIVYLPKPFQHTAVARAIRDCLGQAMPA